MSYRFCKDGGEPIFTSEKSLCGFNLQYVLYRRYLEEAERNAYSIAVIKSDNGETEAAFAYDISSIQRRAKELTLAVIRHDVTPCTLLDVLENLLD